MSPFRRFSTNLIQRCLAKDPDERWQSVTDLKLELTWLQRHESDPLAGPSHAPGLLGRSAPRAFSRRLLAGVLAGGALLGFGGVAWELRPFATGVEQIRSVAVLPFRNVGTDANTAYLSDTLTETIINNLSELPDVVVTSWPAVTRYAGSDPDLDRIRRELKVSAIVTGRLAQRGEEMSIVVEFTNLNANRHIWGHEYRVPREELANVQDNIAEEISRNLRLTLSETEKNRFEATRLYLKGRYYLEKREGDDLKKATALFNEALAKDPRNARIYAGLANSYSLLGYYAPVQLKDSSTKAKANAERAIDLDETLAEAHTALGLVKRDYDFDWQAAEREFKRAIELDPSYATAHQWYAEYLTSIGHFDDAAAEMRLAQKLAPGSLIINADLGWVLYNARHTDEAIEQLQRTIRMDERFPVAHWFLGWVYAQKGSFPRALAELDTSIRLSPQLLRYQADRGYVLALAGRRADALAVLDALARAATAGVYVSQYGMALVHVGLGDRDRAFEALRKAYEDRSWELVSLRVDPMLDRLRPDARFADLVRRMRLPDGP
jgi:TolB-like protein/Tfp pilus assembly protein PilF